MRRSAPLPSPPLSSCGGGHLAAFVGGDVVGGGGVATHVYRRGRSRPHVRRLCFISSSLCLTVGAMVYATVTLHMLMHSPSSTGAGAVGGFEGWVPWTGHRDRILHQPLLVVDAELGSDRTGGGVMKGTVPHSLDICLYCLREKPRSVGYYFADEGPHSLLGLERLDPNLLLSYDRANTRIRRRVMTKEQRERQEALEDSEDYSDGAAETFKDQGKDCVAQYDWQESYFPTCNHLMELDLTRPHGQSELLDHIEEEKSALISNGYWRDVWKVETYVDGPEEFAESYILKMMRYEHAFKPRNYDRHRRDAVATERLTSSPFVVDIYAACGNSGVFEYAGGGSLSDSVWPEEEATGRWTSQEQLVVAYQAAAGVAALHNVGKEGVPSIAHTDITLNQFVYVDNAEIYKLNDFNRARFIGWNKQTNDSCKFHVGSNPGKFRAPEEYAYEGETEKVDIYSLGNVLYSILTQRLPFEGVKTKEAQQAIMNGHRPAIQESILDSTDPFVKAMLKAIEMCWPQDPTLRATAREVESYIINELKRLGVDDSKTV